jgi:hypothetical protein
MGDLVVPGALPTSPRAWRVQQFRWTKGFAQCFIKLIPLVWRSRHLAAWQKLMISFQIGQSLAFVVGVACLIMGLPFMAGAVVGGSGLSLVAFVTSFLGFVAPIAFLAQAGRGEGLHLTFIEILSALVLTVVCCCRTRVAVWRPCLGHRTEFVRTPQARDRKTGYAPIWRNGGTGNSVRV